MTTISDRQSDRYTPCGHVRNVCVVLAATVLLGGCVTPTETAGEDAAYSAWKRLAEDSAGTAPPAPIFDFPSMRDFHGQEAADGSREPSRQEQLPQIAVNNMVLTREMDVGVLLRALADARGPPDHSGTPPPGGRLPDFSDAWPATPCTASPRSRTLPGDRAGKQAD